LRRGNDWLHGPMIRRRLSKGQSVEHISASTQKRAEGLTPPPPLLQPIRLFGMIL